MGLLSSRGAESSMGMTVCRTGITYEGKLREEKGQLEKRLANINAVLDALKKSPEVASVIEAMMKLENY